MLLKALEFALITFGVAMVVAFIVAAIIKVIGAVIQKRPNVAGVITTAIIAGIFISGIGFIQ